MFVEPNVETLEAIPKLLVLTKFLPLTKFIGADEATEVNAELAEGLKLVPNGWLSTPSTI